jgi:hypothetical protein
MFESLVNIATIFYRIFKPVLSLKIPNALKNANNLLEFKMVVDYSKHSRYTLDRLVLYIVKNVSYTSIFVG